MWGPFVSAAPHGHWEKKGNLVGELPWLMFPTPWPKTKKPQGQTNTVEAGSSEYGACSWAQFCTGACLDVSITSLHCRLILEVAATLFLPLSCTSLGLVCLGLAGLLSSGLNELG